MRSLTTIMLVLGVLLSLHIILTMWSQHHTEREMGRVLYYIGASTALQRQICLNTSATAEERNECLAQHQKAAAK